MAMTPRRQRMVLAALVLAGVTVSTILAVKAFRENLSFYLSPSQIAAGEASDARRIRLGGMVAEESVQREEGSLTVEFVITDYAQSIPVSYTGVLPDLFQEGKGVVVQGHFAAGDRFVADEVLAKHDENYMPPEVAEAVERAHAERATP